MPNNNIIIGIVGEIAAGKGVAAEYLKDKYGAVVYRFSTPMRDVIARLYLEPTRENLQKISLILRQGFGEDLFSKVIASDAARSDVPFIITEGIRRPNDIVELAKLPNFHLINIVADERIRYERVKARNENTNDADKTWADFQKDAAGETEMTIRIVAREAEYNIENNSDLETLHHAIDVIIAKIKNIPA